jgi:hypothetical protein
MSTINDIEIDPDGFDENGNPTADAYELIDAGEFNLVYSLADLLDQLIAYHFKPEAWDRMSREDKDMAADQMWNIHLNSEQKYNSLKPYVFAELQVFS